MHPYGDKKKIALLLAAALLGGAAQAQQVGVRIMAQEGIAPKWLVYDDHVEGICPDIIAALERAEPRLRFYGYAQGRALPAMDAGLASGAVQAACALPDLQRRRAFADPVGKPLYRIRLRFAARNNDQAQPTDLRGLARLHALVNVAPNSSVAERLRAAGVAVDESSGEAKVMLRKVQAGHGRFACLNELAIERYLRADETPDRFRLLPLVLEEPAWFWVSRKADPQVRRLVEDALARVQATGELDRIYTRWSRLP